MPWGTASPIGRGRLVAAAFAALALVGACGGTGASPTLHSSTPGPTASPTVAHLADPAAAGDVYRLLRQAGLKVDGTNAVAGGEPRSQINATYAGWPMALLEYSTATTRAKKLLFRDGTAPGKGQPAFTLAGLNIAVLWGPVAEGRAPEPPDEAKLEAARALADALDALIGPLAERSFGRVSTPPPTPSPSVAPSGTPSASP